MESIKSKPKIEHFQRPPVYRTAYQIHITEVCVSYVLRLFNLRLFLVQRKSRDQKTSFPPYLRQKTSFLVFLAFLADTFNFSLLNVPFDWQPLS